MARPMDVAPSQDPRPSAVHRRRYALSYGFPIGTASILPYSRTWLKKSCVRKYCALRWFNR